ncbi:velvet factor [Mycena floridula]|nr:velvet factor [Mycena floridula]
MIQHHNIRQGPLARPASDGPEEWGQWSGRRHYSLEIIQHPSRARMCGFGDKDRRPLAPAAVAKMIVRREDHTIVDIDDVDCSFFLVTVDLWSGDAKQEMNLVLHPSSNDRYVPTNVPGKPRKRDKSSSIPSSRPGQNTPGPRSTPTPSHFRPGDPPSSSNGNNAISPTYPTPAFPFPPPPAPELISYSSSFPSSSSETPTWGYNQESPSDRNTGFPPPVLPSIHTFGRQGAAGNTTEPWSAPERSNEVLPYRPWNTEYSPDGFTGPSSDRGNSERRDVWNQSDNSSQRYSQEGFPAQPPASPRAASEASFAQPTSFPQPATTFYQSDYTATSMPQMARAHTYTRTLVGPLSANATRLMDEHRKPGIFFLFQDLSVRTEGNFRLRLRLMNVGAPPAPEAGATKIHTGVSPVLAQVFTEQFTVYSAKRFPGVPDTTALSIAFGNQGQKLPLVSSSFYPFPLMC